MRPIRVLSLFDGMSCGQIALRELGIPVAAYYASEVDKFAIQQTQLNFPDTVQLGDVRCVDVDKLCDETGEFDLLLAGSPCFAAGTKVLTSEGYKNIEDVRTGDYVLTHQNRYRRVLNIGGKADSLKEGIELAAKIIDSGKATETLNKFIEVSNRPEPEE